MEGPASPRASRRHRVNHACDKCRAKKEKCDGKTPKCSPCVEQNVDCIYGELKRRGKAKKPGRIKSLEERLEAMESLIPLAAFQDKQPASAASEQDTEPLAPSRHESTAILPQSTTPITSKILQNSDNKAVTHSSSDLPAQLQFIPQLQDAVELMKNASSGDLPPKRLYTSLPTKCQIYDILGFFFDDVNPILPIFDREDFMARYEESYPPDINSEDPGWWACLNAVLAVASQRKAADDSFRMLSEYSWGLFRNAMSVYDEITMSPDLDLWDVRAVLAMSFFLKGSSDTKTLSLLISNGARMARILGLNFDSYLDSPEAELRRRVFWIAYILDIDSSVQSMMLPTMGSDWSVNLPNQSNASRGESSEATMGIDIFRFAAGLSVIKARAYRLSVSNAARSYLKPENDIVELLKQLEAWRKSLPKEIRPEWAEHTVVGSMALPVAVLHLEFYSVAHMIHTLSPSELIRAELLGAALSDSEQLWSLRLGTDTCRVTLSLLNHIDISSILDLWHVFSYLLSAAIVIVGVVLKNPLDPYAALDAELLESLVHALLRFQRRGYDIDRLVSGCKFLMDTAKAAIAEAGSTKTARSGKGPVQSEAPPREGFFPSFSSQLYNFDYLAQGLIGNIPGANVVARTAFPDIFQGHERVAGPFSPGSLRPSTYWVNRAAAKRAY